MASLLKNHVLDDTVTAATQTAGDNSTKIATTAYVDGSAGGSTYPQAVYTSGSTGISATAVQSFTHNLGVTQADVEDAKYLVFMTDEVLGVSPGINYYGSVKFGDGGDPVKGLFSLWDSGDPTNNIQANFQANTVKVKSGSGAITGRLIIWQMYA